ncbi:hypothetical protein LEMLEM_LOCUS15159 [Lemmus lemmus]
MKAPFLARVRRKRGRVTHFFLKPELWHPHPGTPNRRRFSSCIGLFGLHAGCKPESNASLGDAIRQLACAALCRPVGLSSYSKTRDLELEPADCFRETWVCAEFLRGHNRGVASMLSLWFKISVMRASYWFIGSHILSTSSHNEEMDVEMEMMEIEMIEIVLEMMQMDEMELGMMQMDEMELGMMEMDEMELGMMQMDEMVLEMMDADG